MKTRTIIAIIILAISISASLSALSPVGFSSISGCHSSQEHGGNVDKSVSLFTLNVCNVSDSGFSPLSDDTCVPPSAYTFTFFDDTFAYVISQPVSLPLPMASQLVPPPRT